MTMPFYVPPEQVMKDRADFARKGIARGRSVVVLAYDKGIAFVAENPSRALHKVSEIYDRIAFAAVGRYNEFESLRVAGIRYADLRGYSYDRTDVTARALANTYAQTLGAVFTQESKPFEIEIVVAEVGQTPDDDQIFRLTYDGSVADERGFVAMGGASDAGRGRRCRALAPRPQLGRGTPPRGRRAGHRSRGRRAPRARRRTSSRSPSSTGSGPDEPSAASSVGCSAGCSAPRTPSPTHPSTKRTLATPRC